MLDVRSSDAWWFWSAIVLFLGTLWQAFFALRDLRSDEIRDRRIELMEVQSEIISRTLRSWNHLFRRLAIGRRLAGGRERAREDYVELGDIERQVHTLRMVVRFFPLIAIVPWFKRKLIQIEEAAAKIDPQQHTAKQQEIAEEMEGLSVQEKQDRAAVADLIDRIQKDDERRAVARRTRRRRVAGGWVLISVGAALNLYAAFLACVDTTNNSGSSTSPSVTVPSPSVPASSSRP
jgi:hypothetical protein